MDSNPSLATPAPFDAYEASPGRYDELRRSDGSIRAPWRAIAQHFEILGEAGIGARANDAEQMLNENGSTYLATGDSGAQTRPWQLSCIPYVIDATTWSTLESGLKQRVRVLEAILDDLLGQRRLIREGVLPAELLSANPEFERSFHGLKSGGDHRLHLTAIDLARNDDGSWWVTAHRTRAPSGLGYSLENRIVTSRVLQNLVHRSNIVRLADFFMMLREHLKSVAPTMRDNPRTVMLTPGATSYRHFEDVYLAQYLGYTLVHGRDLAVRGGELHLKTLGGLLPIQVLWRNISDDQCDPLELDPNSTQGVTGMMQTVRGGKLAVVNSIGSVLAEMPALIPFLPAATKAIFDEELELASVATYWCGDAEIRKYVLDHLDSLIIRPAFTNRGNPIVEPSLLSAAAREELVAQIRSKPEHYVAQERPARSVTPVWHDGAIRSWNVALRTFQLQTDSGVHVMPGGLARVSDRADTLDGNPTTGQLGQDCWIIRDQPEETHTTLLPEEGAPLRLVRGGEELSSRVAEHLFWLGRYVERTESKARLLRTTMMLLSGENEVGGLVELPRLVAALAALGQIEPDYAIAEFNVSLEKLEQELPRTIFDAETSRGLRYGVSRVIDNALALRDRLSSDAYRILTRIRVNLDSNRGRQIPNVATAIMRMDRLVIDVLAFSGLASESFTRSHGWRFLELGRRIERAYHTSELLAATVTEPSTNDSAVLEAVLKTCDSLMTYRSRYLAKLQTAAVLDLLITDETNPRSVLFQLQQICGLLRELPDDREPGLGHDERIAESILYQVRMADPNELSVVGEGRRRYELGRLLEALIDELPELSDAITARYLIHTQTQKLTGRTELP